MHPQSDACVQSVLLRSCIYVSLAFCEAEQAAPSDALVPGSWQCTTHAEAATQAFGANAPKRRCLCAICAKQAMHLLVLLTSERVNRLLPCDALLFGCWQCNNIRNYMLYLAIRPLGPSASTQRCLCAVCATQGMHLHPPLPLERLSRATSAMHRPPCHRWGERATPRCIKA